jgi:peptidyl-prolyl cis-trans isomerase B (cyclophilin B)
MSTAKRERQKANRAARVAQERAAARTRRNRLLLMWVTVAAVAAGVVWALVAFAGGEVEADATATTESPDTNTSTAVAAGYAGFRSQPTACGGATPPERTEMTFTEPAEQGLSGTVTATLTTSCGPVQIEIDADAHPDTANSFVFLALEGYFDGTACHRIVPGFMTQCGDPTATGLGDPGYAVADEFPEEGFVYERGVMAMANAGEGTTGSQFFIVTGDASHLPAGFSLLGTVVDSDDTLDALDAVPVGPNATGTEVSSPQETVYIETVDVG